MLSTSQKKIIAMYGSSLVGVVLGFLVSIFNSRVLGAEKFGDFKFIETVARFIASIVSVGLFISLTRLVAINKNPDKERRLVGLFVIIFMITSAIGLVIFLIFSYFEPYFFENNLDKNIRRSLFIVMVLIGNLALIQILKGLHKIYLLAILGVLPFTCYLVVSYYYNSVQPLDLDSVLLLYYGIQFIFLTISIFLQKPKFNIKKQLFKELLEENSFNGKPIYYGSLAGVATTHIAGLSISYYLENTQVGFFMLSLTVCSPLLTVPSVLGTIYFKKFVDINTIPKKVIQLSVAGTILALVIFYIFIEKVVTTFYSSEYLPVVDISKFLILGFIFHGFGDLINRFLGAKGQGKSLRNAAYLVGIINVLGYTFLIKYFDITGAIVTKIVASCSYLIAMYYYYRIHIRKEAKLKN